MAGQKMDDSASLAFLNEQINKLKSISEHLLIHNIEVNLWDVYVTLTRAKDEKKYTIRLRCDNGYPLTAPSVTFVSSENFKAEGVQFWPDDGEQAFKRKSSPPFICIPGTREYYEHHREVQVGLRDVSLAKIVTELVTMMNR
jgi:hypothetical protein